MLQRAIQFFTSLRLTVVLLGLAAILVFAGTLAQVEQGLYQAQARYFQSLFVYWPVGQTGIKIPIFPGGYLIGALMVLNLLAATLQRLRFTLDHLGLVLVHLGLVLLFLGQLFTDLLSVESAMQLGVGETKTWSEDFHVSELVVTDHTDPKNDRVVSLPEHRVARGGELHLPSTPFVLEVRRYWLNAELTTKPVPMSEPVSATVGMARGLHLIAKPRATSLDERNLPAALLEVRAGGTNLGTWLLAGAITEPQEFSYAGRSWSLALRPKRHYTPFSLTLIDCKHDVYKGTEIPKDFRSRVRVRHPQTGEDREVEIFMNNPLRYGGNTYYQHQMAARMAEKSSTLMVVRNPSWLTPYVSCILVGLGLVWQFLMHLIRFLGERRVEAKAGPALTEGVREV